MLPPQVDPGLVDALVQRLGEGDRPSLDRLIELVYRDLHRMADRLLRDEPDENRTRPTSLVNDLYVELERQQVVQAEDTSHFFHIAGYLMRQILVNRARRRSSQRRGSGLAPLPLAETHLADSAWDTEPETLLALDTALDRLDAIEPVKARIVEMRYFGDLSVEETGRALGISPATVKRHWAVARLWLFDHLQRRTG
ncbi:MAG: RNA polymerase subunit sigma-70 [Bryobacterales bacterium]|nr:RNA polymerase subunit sigma-70 [Bryobacterales bacterium]